MILNSARPLLLTHAKVDADAAGSLIAMSQLCTALDRPPVAVTSGDGTVPDSLAYLLPVLDTVAEGKPPSEIPDLIVFVDCAGHDRANPTVENSVPWIDQATWINIDHHVTNSRFGELNIVVPEAAATCEILEAVFSTLDLEIPETCATAMLSGIYGDTLGLKTPSTRPSTMRACARLIEAGADLDLIVDKQFRMKPYSSIKLWAEIFQTVQVQGKLIWAYVDDNMLQRSGARSSEAEGFVNHIAGTIGMLASALLYEEDSGWRVSMRSPHLHVNVAEICNLFGGGGHPRAAGCVLPPGLASRESFLKQVEALLEPLPIIERTIHSSHDQI